MKTLKTLITIFSLLSLIGLLTSCSGQEAKLKKENGELKQKIAALEENNEALSIKIAALESEISELLETPEKMFEKAMADKQAENYDEALQMLERLTAKAVGQPMERKARDEVKAVNRLKQEKLLAEERARRESFQEIGGGFMVRKVNVRSYYGISEIVGEIKNNAGKDFVVANFVVALYDSEGALLSNAYVKFINFRKESVRTFSSYSDLTASKISRYEVQFENAI